MEFLRETNHRDGGRWHFGICAMLNGVQETYWTPCVDVRLGDHMAGYDGVCEYWSHNDDNIDGEHRQLTRKSMPAGHIMQCGICHLRALRGNRAESVWMEGEHEIWNCPLRDDLQTLMEDCQQADRRTPADYMATYGGKHYKLGEVRWYSYWGHVFDKLSSRTSRNITQRRQGLVERR